MNDCLHNTDQSFCKNPQLDGNHKTISESSLLAMHAVPHDDTKLFFERFFYDNIFFIFVVIVTISMVAGIFMIE